MTIYSPQPQSPPALSLSKGCSFLRTAAWSLKKEAQSLTCSSLRLDKLRTVGFGVAGGLLIVSPVQAASSEDLAAIDRAVAEFTGAPAAPIDRRLRLIPCAQPYTLSWYGTRQDTVEVRCPVAGGWRLFVPLAISAAPPAAPAIARGDAVTIVAGDDSFTVTQPGEALESGPPGAWIKVRPTGAAASAPPLRARVLRPGQVGIALP